ncbi:tRNA epoxyqueuosine(34) reductase QueG [Deinococcus maricopensis]|uniref:4Fe-4S ferredoxin-type domain-containing protein n=1 Tax=Deinococcus maricopensis (strain DSM 21211 / LMG 22137 / NRRL B-23946 / LB-34) TaxID=709986 RepID=E8UAD1_DEIML|nr:tRNA epoxyqueuosine(34) reductase QueG [Deinococcus maricopensis]ADV68020.1 domain of unknown function DUF1730 [Deinococcus maricopensis DSM 21211]
MNPYSTLADLALDLGFDAVGWASAQVPREAWVRYADWLSAGRHADMTYLERQAWRRTDLGTSLPDVSSVLVLGVSHAFPELPVPAGGVRVGRVARYAWTPDYHDQLTPRLERLEVEAARLGVRTRGYVDHGPIMERDLGGRAFLGWQGKSGMLVSTQLGAFLTLAVLLTDLPFEGRDARHPDRCGRCTRCVTACPTGAIGPDRMIDARRCVSYLTIEHRGVVPRALRAGVGEWLFGCDGCLEVCPWSGKAGAVARALVPDAELAHPDLSAFFGGSERAFERRFAGSAFLRARRKGMARNALTVLGNTLVPEGRPLARQGAADPAWEVRASSAWTLARYAERRAVEALTRDPHEAVRAAAQLELESWGSVPS